MSPEGTIVTRELSCAIYILHTKTKSAQYKAIHDVENYITGRYVMQWDRLPDEYNYVVIFIELK